MTYTWLKSDGTIIDAGSAFDLGVRSVQLDFNRFAPSPPVVGDTAPHEVDIVGNANANFVVQGVYFMDDRSNKEGSLMISQARVGSFFEIGSVAWFSDDEFNGAHRMGSWIGGSVAVVPTNFRPVRTIQSHESGSQMVNYQMTLKETAVF